MLSKLGFTLGVGALSFSSACAGAGSSANPSGSSAGSSGSAVGGQATLTGGVGGASGSSAGSTDGGVVSSGGATAGTAGAGGVALGGGGQTTSAAGASGGGASGGGAGGGAGNGGAAGAADCSGLVCEDFESGAIDANKWELVAKAGTLVVQGERVAHGKFAARAHGQAGPSDDWALLVAKAVPPALKGATTFGRVLMYAAADATASIHVQLAFAGHTGSGSANGPAPFSKLRYMEVASYGGRWQLGFDLLDLSPLVEEVSYSKGRFATDAWSCLEWHFEDSPDRVTAWVDGAQASTFDNTNVAYASPGPAPSAGGALWDGKSSELIGGFDTFGFGFHDWHPQRQFDIYYDDLVLDSKRVGCPAK
jgi:hypothetical protein